MSHLAFRQNIVLIFCNKIVKFVTIKNPYREHSGLSNGIVNGCDHAKEESEISENNLNEIKSEEITSAICSRSNYEMNLSEKRLVLV